MAAEAKSATTTTGRRRMSSKKRESIELASLAPGTRVMFLLKEKSELPALFTEMGELGGKEWRETARWVKFEEDVEQGGNRWSKPHVAALSLHALFQLRSCLLNGVFLTELDHADLPSIVDELVDEFVKAGDVEEDLRAELVEILNRKHVHQYEQERRSGNGNEKEGGFLNAVRSISDMGRSLSHGRNLAKSAEDAKKGGPTLELPKVESMPRELQKESSSTDVAKGNTHFLKKLPVGVEASNVLIGEVDFLHRHICAFIRLKTASILGDLTEVPVPTRFIFVLLGPQGNGAQYREIGRAIATLMADEIFHDVAFEARNRSDLIDGIDEFLDQVTVLPPGEWDPATRIEPPSQLPSQEKRKQIAKELLIEEAPGKGISAKKIDSDEDGGGHGNDPALQRTGRLCGGLILDIKRKAPHYLSDFTDALNLQCVATICFMYFALLAPIVTFGGLLEEATHQRMAAMENLFGGAICGIVYHLFSGQPLTIIGSTGPVLVFETIVFDLCTRLGIKYLSFRAWVHVWTALIVFLMCITDASSLVSYITRFTEESFATLIAVIFVYEALMKLWKIKGQLDVIKYSRTVMEGTCACHGGVLSDTQFQKAGELIEQKGWPIRHNDTFIDFSKVGLDQCRDLYGKFEGDSCYPLYDKLLMSILLALGTFFLAITLKKCRNSCYFPSRVRQVFSDFAVMIAIIAMTCIDGYVGINTPKLNVPSTFRPTWEGRGWFIPPFDGNPFWTVPLALLPATLACILIFMDQQITTVIVNRKENKLKKGCGYHLDLLVLSILIMLVGWLGLPIYVAATVLSINHINSLKVESESKAPGEVAQFIGVREQRLTGIVTFVLIGGSVLMTGVLSRIPMPVLYGVFLYMGIAALGGIQLFDRILLLLMPMKYQPDTIYIRHVPIRKIHLFTLFQTLCLAVLWIVKSIKATSIMFPIMLVVMVGVRKAIEVFFTASDLKYLDDPMPDFHLRKKEDQHKKMSNAEAVEIEVENDQCQTTIHAVKTEAHLHIPTTDGKVIKIPLASIQEPSHSINISKELNNSGLWKHITSVDSKGSFGKDTPASPVKRHSEGSEARLAQPEDDDDAIMIKVIRPSPHPSQNDLQQPEAESQPLLRKTTPP